MLARIAPQSERDVHQQQRKTLEHHEMGSDNFPSTVNTDKNISANLNTQFCSDNHLVGGVVGPVDPTGQPLGKKKKGAASVTETKTNVTMCIIIVIIMIAIVVHISVRKYLP